MFSCRDQVCRTSRDQVCRARPDQICRTSSRSGLPSQLRSHSPDCDARTSYRGIGDIVELGCWMGGSTHAIAAALRDHDEKPETQGRIHVFDGFEFLAAPDQILAMYRREGIEPGSSFLNVFLRNLREFRKMIRIHAGDFHDLGWRGYPIEILFIDGAKSWATNDYFARLFFPALIVGGSWVIQQDFCWACTPWIGVLMARLEDYFDHVCQEQSSVVFTTKKRVPEDVLDRGVASLPLRQKLSLFEKWRELFRNEGRADHFELARAVLMATEGQIEAAREIAERLRKESPASFEKGGLFRTVMKARGFDFRE